MKHTPGPWVIDANPFEVWISKGPGHGLVCHCAPYCPPSPNSEQGQEFVANARLIAAAPELLEALKGILEIGKRDTTNPKYDGYYETARAAIAKAEGRS